MAELIKNELGVEAKLTEGGRGEFTVWVHDEKVAKKGWFSFPSETRILKAVRKALA